MKNPFKSSIQQVSFWGSQTTQYLELPTKNIESLSHIHKSNIRSLIKTAKSVNASCLCGNQIQKQFSYFILSKNPQNWNANDNYEVYINPQYKILDNKMENDNEECVSMFQLHAEIPRFKKIEVRYMDENFEEQIKILDGFQNRMFQQMMDFLLGFNFLDWRINHGNIQIKDGAQNDFASFNKVLQEFSKKVLEIKQKYPKTFDFRDIQNSEQLQERRISMKFSYEQQFYSEMLKQIQKDFNIKIGNSQQ